MVFNGCIQILQGTIPVILLVLLKKMIDQVVLAAAGNGGEESIFLLVVLTGLVTLVNQLVKNLAAWGNREQGRIVSDYMSGVLLEKAVDLDFAFFENPERLDELQRAQQQAIHRPSQIVNALAGILRNSVSLGGVLWLLWSFQPLIILVLFAGALPSFLNRLFFSTRQFLNDRKYTQVERRSFYQQMMLLDRQHAKEVRLFQLGDRILEDFRELRANLRRIRHDLDLRNFILSSITGAVNVLLIFSAYGWIVQGVLKGSVSVGGFVLFYQAFQRGQGYLQGVTGGLASLFSHNLFIQNLYTFLGTPSRVDSSEGSYKPSSPYPGEIEVRNVSFSYPGRQEKVLHEVNFRVQPGEIVALVGQNGSGKTTLVKLLSRLYDPDQGGVFLHGHDIRHWDLKALRSHMGVLFQDFIRYNLTLEENIAYGDLSKKTNRDNLKRALDEAGGADLYKSLPRGFDTLLGVMFEQGKELSGGEWQKVALARGLYKDAGILILDEPTSSLDPRAEYEIFQRIGEFLQGRSVILVSHRMATVRMADRICVLHQGRIVEEGTHDQLMSLKGHYHELFTLQAENYQI